MADIEKHIRDLKSDDAVVRWYAADTLRRIGKPAVPALADALSDGNVCVRISAADVLGKIGEALRQSGASHQPQNYQEFCNTAVPALVNALGDEDRHVRDQAAVTLVWIGKPVVPALTEALGDENAVVREWAAWSLGEFVNRADEVEGVVEVEIMLKEASAVLPKKGRRIEAMMGIAKLMKKASDKKNELASKRNVLLLGKPKPPKRGKMYHAARRVRNG